MLQRQTPHSRRARLLLGAGLSIFLFGGAAWAGSTWYRNNSDALAAESELATVIGDARGREGDAVVRDSTRTHTGDLRARLDELSNRLFVDEERIKQLVVKIDWLEARLSHAEKVASFQRCNAEVAGYEAEAAASAAACEGTRTTHAMKLALRPRWG